MEEKKERTVFIASQTTICSDCQEELGTDAWIFLSDKKQPLCLACADLDHLDYLPAGDKALTVRSKKNSVLFAVVVKWNKRRKRYERQGVLVEPDALAKAEQECIGDASSREKKRIRDAEKREVIDREFVARFANQIKVVFPSCPSRQETLIANHACKKYSGRVGRTAAAKEFETKAITHAVRAHVRHVFTNYDELLAKGYGRSDARDLTNTKVEMLLDAWRSHRTAGELPTET